MDEKEPYIHSEEFQKKVSKVGPDSDFSYRSKFDPVPSSELKRKTQTAKKRVILSNPRLLVVAGPNGSGKSSIITSTDIVERYEENIINPDNYARNLSDIDDLVAKYAFAMEQCELLRKNLLENRVTFGVETVASTQGKIDLVKKAIEKGFEIDLIFVALKSPELCCERIKARVSRGGHDVDSSKVFSRYEKTMGFLKEYIELADEARIFDNSGGSPAVVFVKKGNEMMILKNPSDIPWVEKYIYKFFKDSQRVL